MIESVKHIQPELESNAFFNGEVLLNTQVKVSVAGCAQIGEVSRSISQSPGRRIREGRRVEPCSAAWMCDVVVTHDIHMLAHAKIVELLLRDNRERKALFQGQMSQRSASRR